MRIFVAIETSDEMKTALAAMQKELRGVKADVTWVKPESIHLTLSFLGEVEERRIREIVNVCRETSALFRPFTLRLNGSGVFPNLRQPRILWAGLAGGIDILTALQQALESQLTAIRGKADEKAFHPHITIGRVKTNRNVRELVARADLYDVPAISIDVHEVVVMQSELHPSGARYTVQARAPLGAQAS